MITQEDILKLSRAGFKVRSAIGQKEAMRQACRALSMALQNPSKGLHALTRVGVNFSKKGVSGM